jgi:hypothetical protein
MVARRVGRTLPSGDKREQDEGFSLGRPPDNGNQISATTGISVVKWKPGGKNSG